MNEILQGDCLEVMGRIPDGSVDMILADIPYGTTACHWDSIIPLEPMWAQFKRVIKERGAIVMTASQPFTSVLVMSNLDWFKYEWVWKKSHATGQLNLNVRPMTEHENIIVFGKGSVTYNLQLTKKPLDKIRAPTRMGLSDCYGSQREYNRTIPIDMRSPTSVLEINSVNHGERGLHPTQKPVALFAYLIRTYTNPGDLVLDPTAGSGTTAIAAIETGRNWLCIEQDAGYYQLAKERIEERLKQPFLPGITPATPTYTQQELI